MVEENLSEEFRLKNIKEIKNYFIKEINQKELIVSLLGIPLGLRVLQ